MQVLNKEQLEEILPHLKSDSLRSLPMYHMVRNTLRNKFAWPGIEFIVDAFPSFSVCICRPRDDRKGYVPLKNGYDVVIYSKDASVLRKMLYETPGILDWTESILFEDISEPEDSVLTKDGQGFHGGRFEEQVTREGFPPGKCCYSLDLPSLDLIYTVPTGFHLGPLRPEHVPQIVVDRNYGNPVNNQASLGYLLEHGFPSAALFADGADMPVAYCLYRPEGILSTGYVNPQYRKRGFYQLVLKGLLKKLHELGESHVWVMTMRFNLLSQKSLTAVGGKQFEGQFLHDITYIPAQMCGKHVVT